MTDLDLVLQQREKIQQIGQKYGVSDIRLFGSVLKGDNKAHDVDFLIKIEPHCSLFDVVGFQQDLERLLPKQVDVILETSLHWYIKDKVLKEARPL